MSNQSLEVPRQLVVLNVALGGIASFLVPQFTGSYFDGLGFAAGFFLFLANALVIASLSGALIRASAAADSDAMRHAKRVGLFLGALKVSGLFLALYVALIYFALPPTFFALGSLASLVSVVASFAVDYLKRLGNNEQMAKRKG